MRRRTLTLLVIICLGHVMLISAQVQSKSGLPVIESVAFGTLARIQGFSAGIADGVRSIWTRYFALRGVERENADLRQQVLQLQGELQAERARTQETRALEEALKLQQSVTVRTLAARVIAGNPSPGALTVTIDRGKDDGVEADMAVIGDRGLVGRVIGKPAAHAALVQLLIDGRAAADAMLEKTGAGGMIEGGETDGLLRLTLVSPLVSITLGERILSAGQDGIFPQGFLIGTVEWIEGTGKTREIAVKPAVDFSHIQVVLVVLDKPAAAGGRREQ
jgi:rod shape-determining protein MreC